MREVGCGMDGLSHRLRGAPHPGLWQGNRMNGPGGGLGAALPFFYVGSVFVGLKPDLPVVLALSLCDTDAP